MKYRDPFGLYSWDEFLDDASNASAGFGDAISFGIAEDARDMVGEALGLGKPSVNKCSTAYQGGEIAALASSVVRLAYAGIAKVGAKLASSPRAAVALRNRLKSVFRVGTFSKDRMYTYESMMTKYKDASKVKAAAGRTNKTLNSWAAGNVANGGGDCSCQ